MHSMALMSLRVAAAACVTLSAFFFHFIAFGRDRDSCMRRRFNFLRFHANDLLRCMRHNQNCDFFVGFNLMKMTTYCAND